MKSNLLAVVIALSLTCILAFSTVAIAAAFYQQIASELESIQIPPGHMTREVNTGE